MSKELHYTVLSVPHTGTRFTSTLLDVLKVEHKRQHIFKKKYDPAVIDIPENERMVVPWRDPGKVYIGRCQRIRVAEEDRALPQYSGYPDYDGQLDNLLGQYKWMENMLALYPNQSMILPVDKPLASNYWQRFVKFLNISHEHLNSVAQKHIKAWDKVGAFDYRYPDQVVPAEIEEIRERWGYLSPTY